MFIEHPQESTIKAIKVKNNGYIAYIYDSVWWIVRIM